MTANPPPSLTIRISNDLDNIAFIRMIVSRTMPPLDGQQGPLFLGALTEIVTNAIEEHRRLGLDAEVEMTINTQRPETLTVTDFGQGFDADAQTEQRTDGGLGLVISRAVVPDLAIDTGPTGTTITLPYPAPES